MISLGLSFIQEDGSILKSWIWGRILFKKEGMIEDWGGDFNFFF